LSSIPAYYIDKQKNYSFEYRQRMFYLVTQSIC